MPHTDLNFAGGDIIKLAAGDMQKHNAKELKSRYYNDGLEKVFSNADLLSTCFCLFDNDLNVSLTASKLYMHRNTLIYRINAVKKSCGLDLTKFSDAVIFALMYSLICEGK